VFEFPEGTQEAVISRVIREHYAPRPTAPSRVIPGRQANTLEPKKAANLGGAVADFFTGDNRAQRGVGEIAYQSVPVATPFDPARPQTWFDDAGRAAKVGLGMFLDPNEESRAKIIAKQVPTAEFRRDEYGNLQVRYSARSPWAYINRPGASVEDAQTLGYEALKALAVMRIPGLNSEKRTGLIARAATAATASGGATAAGQAAATPLGGSGLNAGDVGVSATFGAGGQAAGDVLMGIAPTVARAVERRFRPQSTPPPMNPAAALEGADATAAQQMADDVMPVPSELGALAKRYGVDLARSQTTGDQEGLRFLHLAAGGMYGEAAQRQAAAFLEAQAEALPAAIKGIAGDASVTSPQAAFNLARNEMSERQAEAVAGERTAWNELRDAARRLQTYDVTPAGRPGAVQVVAKRLEDILIREGVLVRQADGQVVNVPGADRTYKNAVNAYETALAWAAGTRENLPIVDVNRAVNLRQQFDAFYDLAQTDSERRLLTMMRADLTDYMSGGGGGYIRNPDASGNAPDDMAANLAARAPETANRLSQATAASRERFRRFENNRLIAKMLDDREPITDQKAVEMIFGGGNAGLYTTGQGVEALRLIRETVGEDSPAWQALRQGALLRMTANLDTAIATGQTPAVTSTTKVLAETLAKNREALEVLFSPAEIAKMRDVLRILRAVAPPAKNAANPSGSGIAITAAARRALEAVWAQLRQIPVLNVAIGVASDVGSAARVSREISGAPSNISEAIRAAIQGDRRGAAAAASAYGTLQNQDPAY